MQPSCPDDRALLHRTVVKYFVVVFFILFYIFFIKKIQQMHEVYFVYCLKLPYIENIFLVGVNCE